MTDRQTDAPYAYRLDKLCGTGKFEKSNWGGVRQQVQEVARNRYVFEWEKLMGVGRYRSAGIDQASTEWQDSQENSTRKTAQTGVPSWKDRSRYSATRYQFFLDAPFEIGEGCCKVMKKKPIHKFNKESGRMPMTAQTAAESKLRTQQWLKSGCNGFDLKAPISNPMSFWLEQDVLLYLYERKIPIASVYGEIVKDVEVEGQMDFEDLGVFELGRPMLRTTGMTRTGCMFCGFGCHLEKSPNRFEKMKKTHPKSYEWIMKPWDEGGLGYKTVIDWINEHGNMNIKY